MSSIEALFSDVREVQKELEKLNAKRLVNACDIFKLLDTHSLRSDRVQFVTTHLLVRLGLRSNFGEEDIINVPDVLNDSDVSILSNENDDFICDTDSSSSRSHVHNVTRDMNSIMDSSTGHAEALAACQFNISFQVHGPESCSSWFSSSPLSSPSSVAGDASENESYIVLNTNVQGSNTKHNLGPNNSHAVSIPTNQNDNFICDVNKNYPNNNIEYQVPVQAADKQEQLDSTFEDHPEPQPSSLKMNRKAFKRNNVYPFTSRNTKVSKLESAFNKKCQMKVQQGKVSKSYLSVGTPSSKECNTSHVAERFQLSDRAIKSALSATATKQPDIWKESSTSTSNASAEWNIVYMTGITGGIEIASTANDNTQTKPIVVSDDFGLKTDSSESSRPGWEVAKPGTSQADVPAGVPFLQNYPNNNIEYQIPVQAEDKEEQLDSTFEDHPEPQPSSSKMNRKAFKRNNVYPFTSRNTKVSKLESWEVAKPGTSQADVPAGVPFLQEETSFARVHHKCNVCYKTFKDKSNFRKHKRIHTGHRPYSCNQCPKAYGDRTALKQHLRMHSGDRPYICNVCGKGLFSKFNLTQHYQRVHNLFK